MNNIKSILGFLNKLEKLKFTFRHERTSTGTKVSVADHSWRLAIFALLSKEWFPSANMEKLLKLALVHDIAEIITGDILPFKKNGLNKEIYEQQAITEMTNGLDEKMKAEIFLLWKEYSDGSTQESKIIKALDKLEGILQHTEADINTWNKIEYEFLKSYGENECKFNINLNETKLFLNRLVKNKIKNNYYQTK